MLESLLVDVDISDCMRDGSTVTAGLYSALASLQSPEYWRSRGEVRLGLGEVREGSVLSSHSSVTIDSGPAICCAGGPLSVFWSLPDRFYIK